MNKNFISLAIAGMLLGTAPAYAMTKAEQKAEQDRIAADYKLSHDKCKGLSGNAQDICMAEAQGAEKVAKADLEANYHPSAKTRYQSRAARADAAYATAKEKCDDFAGNAKDVCRGDAKAAHVRALADAKADRKINAAQNTANEKIGEVRKDADEDKRNADYKAARERCDALAGDAKDRCVSDAKARFAIK